MSQTADQKRKLAGDAIALMTQLDVEPSPDNYSVFHTYCAGTKPELKRAVDVLIGSGNAIRQAALDAIRDEHLAPSLEAAIANLGAEMNGTLTGVLEHIARAARDTTAYEKTLSAASGELGGVTSGQELTRLVGTLLSATQAMEARTKDLETELHRSSKEVEDLKSKLDDVRLESLTDPLTGIRNRKALDIELERAFNSAREHGEPLCLFMCDIDRFKMFNDTWGHQTGDQVLKLVAQCLSENVKGRDTAARYGGEEFAVILPQTELADAVNLANAIRKRVESKKLLKKSTGDILGAITISVGVSQLTDSDTIETLVRRADSCLYAAKRGGRNLVMAQTEAPASRAA